MRWRLAVGAASAAGSDRGRERAGRGPPHVNWEPLKAATYWACRVGGAYQDFGRKQLIGGKGRVRHCALWVIDVPQHKHRYVL